MRKRVRRAVVVFTLVGVASIVYGVAIVVRFLESTRLDATGERVAGVILIIGGLACVGVAIWSLIWARRMDNNSA
jgi:hypothetical protein